jgi:hypothetical protein
MASRAYFRPIYNRKGKLTSGMRECGIGHFSEVLRPAQK